MEHKSWLQLVTPTMLREEVLREFHKGAAGGHLGQDKTLLKERFYWPGHYNDVKDWCQTCATCASRKAPTRSSRSPLGTITASYPTQIMAIDIIGPFPTSDQGNSLVGDYFSRWMEALPIPNQEASNMKCFYDSPHLSSCTLIRAAKQLIQEVCKLLHISKTGTTPYHPPSDGLVEWFNKTLLAMLATCAKSNPLDWEKHVRKVCMAYNSSVQASTGYTPFYLMFGRQARLLADVIYGTPNIAEQSQSAYEYARNLKRRMENAFTLARQHSLKHHQRQKELYVGKVHGKPFEKGEYVWLNSPMGQKGASRKLHHPWAGPFKVLKRISDSTYRIQKLEGRKRKKIVHFNRLKSCPNNIRLEDCQETHAPSSEQVDTYGLLSRPALNDALLPIGHGLELLDDPSDDGELAIPTHVHAEPIAPPASVNSPTRRYPRRDHRMPTRYDNFVPLHRILENTPLAQKEGGDVTV